MVLYQNISQERIKEVIKVSSIYLDINHYAEVQGIVRKAFEHQQVILAFSHTLHDRYFLALKPISLIKEKADMVARIQEIYQSVDNYREAVHNKLPNQVALSQLFSKLSLQEGIGGHSE